MTNIICFFEKENNIPFLVECYTDDEIMEIYTKLTVTDMFEHITTDSRFFNSTDSRSIECIKKINKLKKSSIKEKVFIGWYKSDVDKTTFKNSIIEFLNNNNKYENFNGFKEEL